MLNCLSTRGSKEPLVSFKYAQSGFTLIEMILTILIIGILSYVAFSQNLDFAANEDGNAYQQSISVLRNAQKYAIARRTRSYVIVNNSQIKGCWDVNCTSLILNIDGGALQTDTFSNKFSSSGTPIVFLPDGNTTTSYVVSIGSHNLNIENITGYAH